MTLRNVAFTIAILLSCIPSQARNSSPEIYLEDFSCNRGPHALNLKRSLHDLRRLPSFRGDKVDNISADGEETHTLIYTGMTIRIVFAQKNYDDGLIENVSITSKGWSVAPGIRVGSSADKLSARFKLKLNSDASSLEVCGDGDCGKYFIDAGRVSRIEYSCYTG